MKKYVKGTFAAVIAVAALALLLGAAAGGQADPLITKSYLDEVAVPAILAQVDAKLESREDALADKLSGVAEQYRRELEELLESSGGTTGGGSSVFAVVTVPAGQQLVGNTGCEFLLRSGSAVCVAESAPGLIDSTDGGTLASGGAVQPNHLYLITADSRGFPASTDVTVLVRGNYSIG